MVLPVPRQLEHGARHREEALLVAKLAGALALCAGFCLGAGRRTGSLAGLAGLFARNLDRRLCAGGRLLEGDLQIVAKVRAALRPAAPPPRAEDVAEAERVAEPGEDVGKVREDRRVEPVSGRRRSRRRVRSDRRGARFSLSASTAYASAASLNRSSAVMIAGIAVRMELQRQLAIRALDLRLGGLPLDLEDLVVVALGHATPSLRTLRDLDHGRAQQALTEHVAAPELLDHFALAASLGRIVRDGLVDSSDRSRRRAPRSDVTPRLPQDILERL